MVCNHIKIEEYCIKWQAVEGYKRKDGKEVFPYLRKVKFRWQ